MKPTLQVGDLKLERDDSLVEHTNSIRVNGKSSAAAFNCISPVLGLSTELEVFNCDTGRRVAAVANDESRRDWPTMQDPREAVGAPPSTLDDDLAVGSCAVSIGAPCPEKTAR